MNEQDTKLLAAEVCKRWKGKFTAQDLAYWAKKLDGFEMSVIVQALTEFKNNNRFAPKIPEILKMLPHRVQPGDGKPRDEGTFADVLRRQNRQYEGRSNAEVYLRYYRQLWVTYSNSTKDHDGMVKKLTNECMTNLVTTADYTEPQAKIATDFIFDSPDAFRTLLDEIRNGVSQPQEHVFTE